MPAQEQALEYLTVPEQADAYTGTSLGLTMTCLAARVGRASLFLDVKAIPTIEYDVGVIVTVLVLEGSSQYLGHTSNVCRLETTYDAAGVMV